MKQQVQEIHWAPTPRLKEWSKCAFCGALDPYIEGAPPWRYIYPIDGDMQLGGKACPECAPREVAKLLKSGVLR